MSANVLAKDGVRPSMKLNCILLTGDKMRYFVVILGPPLYVTENQDAYRKIPSVNPLRLGVHFPLISYDFQVERLSLSLPFLVIRISTSKVEVVLVLNPDDAR